MQGDGHEWAMVHFNGDGTFIPDSFSPEDYNRIEELFQQAGIQCIEEMENHYSIWASEADQLVRTLTGAGLVGCAQYASSMLDPEMETSELIYPRL